MNKKHYVLLCVGLLVSFLSFADKFEDYRKTYNVTRALELFEEGKRAEAKNYLEKEFSANEENYVAAACLAKTLCQRGEYGQALLTINTALKYADKKNPFYISILQTRADIYIALGNKEKAKEDLDTQIKLFPKSYESYNNRGRYFTNENMYESALSDLKKAKALDSDNYSVIMNYAIALRKSGNYDDAISETNHMLKLFPNYAAAFQTRGLCYMKKKEYEKAADDFIQAYIIAKDIVYLSFWKLADSSFEVMDKKLLIQQMSEPNIGIWPYHRAMIRCHGKNNDFKSAIPLFEASLKLQYSNTTIEEIANCWNKLGSSQMALNTIQRAVDNDSTVLSLLAKKLNYLEDLGRYDEALSLASRMIELQPRSMGGYFGRACIKKITGDREGAIEDFFMASLVFDTYPMTYLQRGYQYRLLGKESEAVADFKKVIAIDTIPSEATCAAYAHAALGDREKAVALMDSILSKDSLENYYDAACLYSRLNEKETSLKYLQLALRSGFRKFGHINRDEDLDNIKDLPEFKSLIAEYKAKAEADINSIMKEEQGKTTDFQTEEIPFTHEGGVTKVKCMVNDLPLHFIFDTGASDVTISMIEATFMLKNGYLKNTDFTGKQYYQTADGSINEGATLILQSIKVGNLELTNVKASVVKSQNAPLLLGQSVLQRLGKIEIDNTRNILKITNK